MTQKRFWVTVADLEKTRIFEFIPLTNTFQLVTAVQNDHSQSEGRQQGSTFRSSGEGLRSLTNEHSHERRLTEGYIQEVCTLLTQSRKEGAFGGLFLVAGPKTMGLLRQHLDKETQKYIEGEITKDYARFSTQDIYYNLQSELENPALAI